jgi:hypothetical protein
MTFAAANLTTLALMSFGIAADNGNSTTGPAVSYIGPLDGIYGTAVQRGSATTGNARDSIGLAATSHTNAQSVLTVTSRDLGYEQVRLDPQQATTLPSIDILEAPLLVRLSGRDVIEGALRRQQNEEVMDHVSDTFEAFLDQYGAVGILGLASALARTAASSDLVEPLWWQFLRALGKRRNPIADQAARRILVRQLELSSGGRRSAAAAGLGGFGDPAALAALVQRARAEQNRFVLATLKAHIRSIRRANGLPSETAA